MSFLFPVGAPDFAADKGRGGQPRCLIQPSGEDDVFPQRSGFLRKEDEHRLGDFLGVMRIARVAQRHGVDLVDVSRDELGKGFLGMVLDVFAQQGVVI